MKHEVTLSNRIAIFLGSILFSILPLLFEYWMLVPEQFTTEIIAATFIPLLSDIDILSVIISFSFNVIIQQVAIPLPNKKKNTSGAFSIWIIYFILMIIAYTVGAIDHRFRQIYQSSCICNLIFGGLAILFCGIYFFRIAYIRKHAPSNNPDLQELHGILKKMGVLP